MEWDARRARLERVIPDEAGVLALDSLAPAAAGNWLDLAVYGNEET